jgi:YgiT-type zinc finger domain-containing protein
MKMDQGESTKNWRAMSEEIISGVAEWRQQHPKATFREIEEEVDQRLSQLRARMLSDAAIASASADWEKSEAGPHCPNCGAELQIQGKKKRKMQTRGRQEIELEREYGICPKCGQGIFPPG